MITELASMREGISKAAMARAGEILKTGGLVAFPTETVYGLGGNALDAGASQRIYAAKGRPSDNPLIVHIADWEAIRAIVSELPEKAGLLAKAFWPGPLTMILKKSEAVPLETTGGLSTVAVRMPSHPVALALIRAGGGYVAAPSANTSGRPSPTAAAHVLEDLNGKIEMILDGGEGEIGIESTIVDLTEDVPVILRPGYINKEMLEAVVGEVRVDRGLTDESVRPKAPGMKYRHYAPKAQLFLVEGSPSRVTAKINLLCEQEVQNGRRAGVIAARDTAMLYKNALVKEVGSRTDELSISQRLYAILREFDAEAVDVIYSEAFETPQMGVAIMNRLVKAAGHQIILAEGGGSEEI